MDATALFVEILITGLESGIWICFLISTAIGPQWITELIDQIGNIEVVGTTALLAFAYVLGIIVEEMTDAIYEPWSDKLKASFIKGDMAKFYKMQIYVSSHGGREDDQFNFMRSRRRILRASSFNIALIGISTLIYI